VTLLFDQNLSNRLVTMLAEHFPDARHVRDVGLARASDAQIWDYSRREHLTIVTKDVDFHEWSVLHGHPPKVIWIRRGNCATGDIAALLMAHCETIDRFDRDDGASVLELH